jgi:hypothetical protein
VDQGVVYNPANNVGFTLSGATVIPANQSMPANDVLGAALQYAGQSPYPATIESPCVRMDGTNDYALPQSNIPVIANGAAYAIMKPDGGTVTQYLICAMNPTRLFLTFDAFNRIQVSLGVTTFAHTVVETDWVKVGVTWDSSGNFKVFRNGVIIVTSTYIGTVGGGASYIGCYDGSTNFFKGYASDVRIYNAAKSDAEMLAITNGYADTTGLYAWWPMQEGGGLSSYDISGNGNHLNWKNITESTFWANRNDAKTQDVAMLYGGRWAGENRIAGSEALQSSPWSSLASTGTLTVTGNFTTAPDGSSRATRLVFSGVSTNPDRQFLFTSSASVSGYVAGSTYNYSVWFKGNSGGERVYLSGTPDGVSYQRKECVLTTTWQRFDLTLVPTGVFSFYIGIDMRDGSQTATPAQTIFAWGAQISASIELLPYVRTYTVAQPTRSFVPGSPLGDYCVDTLDLVSVAGKYSNPYSRLLADPFDAAEFNNIAMPIYETLPCLTGNGSDNYVDLGSALIPATADFEISLWYYHVTNDTTLRGIVSQYDGVSGSGRFSIEANIGAAGGLRFYCNSSSDLSITIANALTAGAWHKITFTRVGNVFTGTCQALNGNTFTGTQTLNVSILQISMWLGALVTGAFRYNNGRIAYLTVTTGGVTKEVPLTAGSGANLTLYTDSVESTLTAAIKGTIAGVWANLTDSRMPSTQNAYRAIIPLNTKFRRASTAGDNRFIAFRTAQTGTNLNNLIDYTE